MQVVRLSRWWRWSSTSSAVLLLLTLTPILAAIVHAWRAGWVPIGDHGLIELRAADVFTADHPWLGTWTSASLSVNVDLNNPGPLLFDLLAPFVKLLGGSAGGVVGVAAINAGACAVALHQGRRMSGRRGELIMAAACLSLSWSMGSEMLIDPWQPHVLLLPFLAFLACAAASALGEVRSVPWMVAIACLLVQSHLSFAYLVAAVGAVALGLCVWSVRVHPRSLTDQEPDPDSPTRPQWRRSAVSAVVVAIVCWSQPLYEQLFGPGEGNLSRLAGASSSSSEMVGPALGIRLVARIVAIPPWFLRPSFEHSIPNTSRSADGSVHVPSLPPLTLAVLALTALLLLTCGLAIRLMRIGDRPLAHLLLVAVAAVLGALGTMIALPLGPLGLAAHQMRWLWPSSVLLLWGLAAGLARLAAERWPSLGHRQAAMTVVVILAAMNLPAHLTDSGPATLRQYRPVLSSMIDQLEDVRLSRPAQFDSSNLRFAEPFSGPMLFALLDNNQPVTVVDEGFIRQLGEGRRASGDELWSVQVLEREAALAVAPASTVLAYADGLSTAQRDELESLEASGTDSPRLNELQALRRSLVVAIVLTPRG